MTVSMGGALAGIAVCIGLLTLMVMGDHWLRRRRFSARLRLLGQLRAVPDAQPRKANARDRGGTPTEEDLALMVVEVSAHLRAGAPIGLAWERTWERHGTGPFSGVDLTGAPTNLVRFLERQCGRPGWAGWIPGLPGAASAEQIGATQAVVTACRFSFLTGSALAEVLDQVAESIAQTTRARRAQAQAFTGPKLSSRVLTALPLLAIGGGELLGAGSLGWLLGGGIGTLCAAGGVLFLLVGHGISRRMIDTARADAEEEIGATLLGDLARAGLRSGSAIPAVLAALGKAQQEQGLERVARELVMGSAWEQAWAPLPPHTTVLYRGLQPGWEDGVSPLALLERMTMQIRERRVAQAEEEAAKLAVKLVVPLGLFLLPAFVLLGIVPVIFALIGGQVGL